jgi:hypothetical protein
MTSQKRRNNDVAGGIRLDSMVQLHRRSSVDLSRTEIPSPGCVSFPRH